MCVMEREYAQEKWSKYIFKERLLYHCNQGEYALDKG